MEKLTEAVTHFLQMQIDAGVERCRFSIAWAACLADGNFEAASAQLDEANRRGA